MCHPIIISHLRCYLRVVVADWCPHSRAPPSPGSLSTRVTSLASTNCNWALGLFQSVCKTDTYFSSRKHIWILKMDFDAKTHLTSCQHVSHVSGDWTRVTPVLTVSEGFLFIVVIRCWEGRAVTSCILSSPQSRVTVLPSLYTIIQSNYRSACIALYILYFV